MMHPQHIARRHITTVPTAALGTHVSGLKRAPYPRRLNCGNVNLRNTRVSLTSHLGSFWHEAVPTPSTNVRRLRCPRASQCWPHSALSQPFRPAHLSKKNMLWLHPSLSRLSQYTQVSTSKTCRGQAHLPAPTQPQPRVALVVRGVSC